MLAAPGAVGESSLDKKPADKLPPIDSGEGDVLDNAIAESNADSKPRKLAFASPAPVSKKEAHFDQQQRVTKGANARTPARAFPRRRRRRRTTSGHLTG